MIKKIGVIVFTLFTLSACNSVERTEETFEPLEVGMTQAQVIDELGEASKTITDQTTVKEIAEDEFAAAVTVMTMAGTESEDYSDLEATAYEVGELRQMLEEGKELTILQYEYQYVNPDGENSVGAKNLYFDQDALVSPF